MRIIIADSTTSFVCIGRQGENAAAQVQFPVVEEWEETYGSGVFQLLILRPTEATPYAVPVTTDGTNVLWTVGRADVSIPGIGGCELRYVVGGTVAKSQSYVTLTDKSIGGSEAPYPTPWEEWVDQVLDAAASAEADAGSAAASASAAQTAQTAAETAQTAAETAQTAAEAAKDAADLDAALALEAKAAAQTSASSAAQDASDAAASQAAAAASALSAESSADAASYSASAAQTAQGKAETAQTAAEAAQAAAEAAEDTVAADAAAAAEAKNTAVASASAAASSEEAAAASETAAAGSAASALASQTAAAASETAAAGSADAASGSASAAAVSATAAETAQTAAETAAQFAEYTQPSAFRTVATENGSGMANVWTVHNAADRKAKSVIVRLDPKQSGAPSASSPAAITGYTSYSIRQSKGNLFDPDKAETGMYITANSGSLYEASAYWTTDLIPVSGISSLRMRWKNDTSNNRTARITFYDADKNYLPGSYYGEFGSNKTAFRTGTRTVPSGAAYVRFGCYNSGYLTVEGDSSLIVNAEAFPEAAGTVYGGTVDVTNGKLYVTWAGIASYAGETLPGRWLSSMDVYEEGATPTTGAQVVYELASPTVYDMTPHEIRMTKDTMLLAPASDPYQHAVSVTYCCDDILNIADIDDTLTESRKPADAATVGNRLANLDVSVLNRRIVLYPSQYIGRRYRSSADLSTVSSDKYVTPISPLRFAGKGVVHIYSTDPYITFRALRTSASDPQIQTSFVSEYIFDGSKSIYLEMRTSNPDSSYFQASDFASVYVMTSEEAYEYATSFDTYMHRFETSGYIPNYADASWITRYGMWDQDGQNGIARGSRPYHRITAPLICGSDFTLYPGRTANGIVVMVLIDGQITEVNGGSRYTIPANTVFALAFRDGTNLNETSSFTEYVKYVVSDKPVPSGRIMQYLGVTGVSPRCDSAFMIGDHIYAISQYGSYSAYDMASKTVLADSVSLDKSAGHANNCNYMNGSVYISDWTTGNIIHVYTVDDDAHTLTWSKDITVDNWEYGSADWYVTDDEKQLFFLGWRTGNSGTSQNCLVYGLYVYTTGGYELSWVKKAPRPAAFLQGMTVQDRYIYYISCTSEYDTDYIQQIDMTTGITTRKAAAGTLAESEGEAIIPVGSGAFLIAGISGTDRQLFVYMQAV